MNLQGSVEERSAAILSQGNLNPESLLTARKSSKELESERACPFLPIQRQLLCEYMIPSSLTLLFLPDQLSYSVPLFCSAFLKANDLIQFTLYWRIDFSPAHPKQQIIGNNFKWLLLCGFYRCLFSCLGSRSITNECMKFLEANIA